MDGCKGRNATIRASESVKWSAGSFSIRYGTLVETRTKERLASVKALQDNLASRKVIHCIPSASQRRKTRVNFPIPLESLSLCWDS
uniref:Uncharacterized protein n=1 Tax=Trichuris muris TaxID=70415 RepID=A0A5S6QHH4_TRIMR